jgi:hypothetical protein
MPGRPGGRPSIFHCIRGQSCSNQDRSANTIFTGGSRRLSHLPSEIKKRLDDIIANGHEVIVGDASRSAGMRAKPPKISSTITEPLCTQLTPSSTT